MVNEMDTYEENRSFSGEEKEKRKVVKALAALANTSSGSSSGP